MANRLGKSIKNNNDLDGNITEEKISFFNEILRHTIIGVELFHSSFFKMQLGYSFRRSEELRILDQNFSGISFGFGMKFNKLRFNYCHSRCSSASNIEFYRITIRPELMKKLTIAIDGHASTGKVQLPRK